MEFTNEMKLELKAISENESFARMVIAAFTASLNPTLEELGDVKTAVSEAVTNAIIHGYEGNRQGVIRMHGYIKGKILHIVIEDDGVGIPDIARAMTPLYTSKPELERSGMGFSFMEAFMDELTVESEAGAGTKVMMKKIIGLENKYE